MRNNRVYNGLVLLVLGTFASCTSANVPSQRDRNRDAIIAASDDHMREPTNSI